jgi:scyllo-inositol 2-dehydrogenase (NADP+)
MRMKKNHKIQTALASFGMSGQVFHGPSLLVHDRFEIKTILERSANLSRKMFPGVHIARDYREILKDPDVELIIVNTPDALHYNMAYEALTAGKHVVVEKPFTLKAEEASRLIDLARKKDLTITVYQNRRWDGDFKTVQKVLQSGVLGRLVEFESHFDRYRTYIAADTWKEKGDEYSGVLYNLGSHMVDQALVLFGMPENVSAHTRIVRDGGKVADYYDIRLGYENFSAILKCSYLVKEAGPRYILHGTKGSFLKWGIDPQEEMLKKGYKPNSDDWGAEQEKNWGVLNTEVNGLQIIGKVESERGDYLAFYDNLSQVLRADGPLAVKPDEAMNVVRILELCLESQRMGSTVRV